MTRAVIFDLDSTLADTRHRQWMIPLIKQRKDGRPVDNSPTWETYSLACGQDTRIESTVRLAQFFAGEAGEPVSVVIVTGRSSAAREDTERWLLQNAVPYDRLIMRAEGDRTPNPVFKVSVLDDLTDDGWEIILFVDDYPAVADAVRHYHPEVPVLLVNPGYHGVEGA
jgi:phosphoglycolate phosphatase-like HAD superfamily hydrolase